MYYGYDSIISKIYSSMKRNEVTNQLLLSMNENKLNKTIFNESMNQLLKSNSLIQIVNQKYFYDDLPYNLAISKDKRKFYKMFKHNFMEKYPISRIFKKLSVFELLNLNIIIYLSYLEIMFSIDGILYSNSQISKDFHGLLKYHIPLLYSFYSFILGNLILNLFKYIISYSSVLDTYIKEIKNNDIISYNIFFFEYTLSKLLIVVLIIFLSSIDFCIFCI